MAEICHFSYTCRIFVRFPIAPDKVPDRDWLGAPLKNQERKAMYAQYKPEKQSQKSTKNKKLTTIEKNNNEMFLQKKI